MSETPKNEIYKGRGAAENPGNRFEAVHHVTTGDEDEIEATRPTTQFLTDHAKSILSHNDSPDVPFDVSINPYRGCEHGCVYCYARPTHEYLGFSSGIDFETKILVKEKAPELLRAALSSKRYEPKPIAMSGVTDIYQPVERKLRLTRACLEVLAEFRNPAVLITKNALVTRDIDLLSRLAEYRAVQVFLSVTTLDSELCGVLEPRTSRPHRRLEAIRELSARGIPVGVMMAPIIPGLTEEEIPSILEAAVEAGAVTAGWTMLRLPLGNVQLFETWLDRHRPERKAKVLGRLAEVRGGGRNDPRFGSRMRGEGIIAEQIRALFKLSSRRLGLGGPGPELSTASFRRLAQPGEQLALEW